MSEHAFADARDDLPFFVNYELDDIGLDPYEFRAYIHALRRASGRKGSGTLWESVMKAAKHCRMDHKTYRRSLASLVEKGLLAAVERKGRTTEYFVLPKRRWRVPLPETVDPPLPDTEGVPLPDTVDEVIHIKGCTRSKNPLSTFVDSEGSASPRSEEKTVGVGVAYSLHEEASPSLNVDTARANNKNARMTKAQRIEFEKSRIATLVTTWNQHRGGLPEVRTVGAELQRKALLFLDWCDENSLDPEQALAVTVRAVVASGDYYKAKRDRKTSYGLGNLLAKGNWEKYYDSGMDMEEAQAPIEHDFKAGNVVHWLADRHNPDMGYRYGTIMEFFTDDSGVLRAKVQSPWGTFPTPRVEDLLHGGEVDEDESFWE